MFVLTKQNLTAVNKLPSAYLSKGYTSMGIIPYLYGYHAITLQKLCQDISGHNVGELGACSAQGRSQQLQKADE